MSIAITADHRELEGVVADLLGKRDARAATRAILETPGAPLPDLWKEYAELGWLGLHVPESHGGSGYGLEELVVVVEQLGRHVAPGPFVPTVIASATLAAVGGEVADRLLPGLVDGSLPAGVALEAPGLTVSGGTVSGTVAAVAGAPVAGVLLLPAGDDVLVVAVGDGVTVETRTNLDPHRYARVVLDSAPATVLAGAGRVLTDLSRTLVAAEAAGVAGGCVAMATEYAGQRQQFGRIIGSFQAVKHHCADMLVATETAIAAVWDAARASSGGGDQFSVAAAAAAAIAGRSAYQCANLNIQVHGGIGYTWEHDAHLYLRRAVAIEGVLGADAAAREISAATRRGVARTKAIELPPEAEPVRTEVRAFVAELQGLDADARRAQLVETGYMVAAWPEPWGRDAGPVEQLVIEEEFGAAGIERRLDPISSYVSLTLVSHAAPEQLERWVPPVLAGDFIWCQLFSEPDAGSDAAAITTRATRTEGGWLLNGQKVWTSQAHHADYGLATVRTNPDVPKHKGITVMAVRMDAPGVQVRPLRQLAGEAHFNEVFLDDVFVPDADVVGPVDGGWTVARATLGNESVSVGNDDSNVTVPGTTLLEFADAAPGRLDGAETRIGHYIARKQALAVLNLRAATRAVAGGGPSPEGAFTKLILSQQFEEAASILAATAGPELTYLDGPRGQAADVNLTHRVWSIGGGTSEIKRNQIGERLLGLPREPAAR